MCTKLISFVCVLALALASTSYGQNAEWSYPIDLSDPQPILVGNWEGSFDEWRANWGDTMFGFSSTGATLNGPAGAYEEGSSTGPTSLKVVTPTGGWASAFALKLQGRSNEDLNVFGDVGIRDDLFPIDGSGVYGYSPWNMFEMDITVLSADWIPIGTPDPYISMILVLNTGGFDASWNWAGVWGDAGGVQVALDGTTHCVWDLSAAMQATVDDVWNAGYNVYDKYIELVLVTDNDGYGGFGTYYIDAAFLVPEPATIALLGLGGLALIRKRR